MRSWHVLSVDRRFIASRCLYLARYLAELITIPHQQLGTLLRSKRKIEELSNVIQEQRRHAAH